MKEVYHEGEKWVQQQAGEVAMAASNGKVIVDTIIKGAIPFIEKQAMAIASSSDEQGNVWASLLIGDFGFVTVPEPSRICFNKDLIRSAATDIFYNNIRLTKNIGSLFIELATRRRYRVNGFCEEDEMQLNVTIAEAYPNCPKYIQRRVLSQPDYFLPTDPITEKGTTLTPFLTSWIEKSDTFFVGSKSFEGRLDASHRGGPPRFVEVLDNDTLKIPDYSGNSLFNTLGNLVQTPQAGLLFIDFEKRETLQLTGTAELLFNQQSAADLQRTGGTGRFWLFHSLQWRRTINHHKVAWAFLDYSPFNP